MLVPLSISPHLVPFLVEELSGKLDRDKNLHNMQVIIYGGSALGGVISSVLHKDKKHVKFCLVMSHVSGQLSSHCNGYICDHKGEVLYTDLHGNKLVNDLLDNILRTALIFWVSGTCGGEVSYGDVNKAIDTFMENYMLYDHNFNIEQLRRIYYDGIRRKSKISRFQRANPHNTITAKVRVTNTGDAQ